MGTWGGKRRSKSQLRAISYSYSRNEQLRLEEIAKKHGVYNEFTHQNKYKTIRGFLKAKKIIK